MKITLIDIQLPSVERTEGARLAREPIGLLELGAFLKRERSVNIGYTIVDSEGFDVDLILGESPDVVGFSTYSYSYPLACSLAREIKKRTPDRGIIFGGPHAGLTPESVMTANAETIDAVVADEGEIGFLKYLDGERGIIRSPKLALEQVPIADRVESLLENSNFRILNYQKIKTAVILASRGCTRSCDFCITRLTGYRAKPIENVVRELEFLVHNYDVKLVIFEDPLLNGNLHYLERLCDRLASERDKGTFGKEFYLVGVCDFNFGIDPKNILKKMARAQFIQINWGIEDPRQKYRTELNKKIRIQADILTEARKCGIYNRGLLMLPTNLNAPDSEADIKSYTESLVDLELDEVKVNVTTPFPGTPFYDRLVSSGKIIDNDWKRYDTHHLVFHAGDWTQEIIDWGRRYIVSTFNEGRKDDRTKL